MKRLKILRILATALTLALLVAALPATTALAQTEDLNLLPNHGEIGDSIEAWGSGFGAGSQYRLYFSDELASLGEDIITDVLNYEFLKSVIADANGTFEYYYFDVPRRLTDGYDIVDIRGGTYYVYATDYSYDIVARATFTVESTAAITLDPDDGTVGTLVEITGEGFDGNEDIIVEYGNDDVDIESGDTDTDSDGDFTCTIYIPESTAGDHTITVTGDDSNTKAVADFTVEPSITVNPASGAAGSTATVTGTGFGDEVDYTVSFDGDEVADDETDNDGSFSITFTVPSVGAGSYDIDVEDDDGNDADAVFSIAVATMNINPTSGYVNTAVTVSGTGFRANNPIDIFFNNEAITSTSTNQYGEVSTSFNIPSIGAGTYIVKVTDGTNTVQDNFTISTSASISPETSTASPGYVGTELTISGVGFIAGQTATVTYDGTEQATATVGPDGSFSAKFTVPDSIAGQHTVTVTDGTNTQQFTFVMESEPPSTIYPQLPYNESKLEDWQFDWCGDSTDLSKEVTDNSLPVTYTLQIATSQDFSPESIVLEAPGLTESKYTISKEDKLEPADEENPYYWRVKAIDSASNEGPWSGIGEFYVGGISWSLPTPVVITLIVIGVLALGVLAFWFGRKTAYY